jgi:excinuclease ABC subunit C
MSSIQPQHTIPPTREAINGLPTTTGIYIFCHDKEILYIGKSVSLKARLLSHLENAKINAKEAAIVTGANIIQCIITDSEFKALLLESQLIQKHRPKYNVRWMDDKSYLYIKVTIKDEYPKLYLTRKEDDKKSLYFGPFPSVQTATNVLREIRKVFPFCTQKRITRQPCFYSKIGQCNPCPNFIDHVQDATQKRKLKQQYRYNIRQVIKVLEGRTDLVLNNLYKELKKKTQQIQYEEAIQLRNRIYRLEGLIHGKKLEPEVLSDYNRSTESTEQLKHILEKYFPHLLELERIECYDISNFQGKESTASMVVFTEGLIDKKEYRRFKIKDQSLPSDFDRMKEVLKRRFKNDWKLPDLIVVDGGKPQVRIALQAMAESNIHIPLIGIAKHPDRLVIGAQHLPFVRPSLNNLGFNLIRAIRDESHRFAKKYHVLLRERKMSL